MFPGFEEIATLAADGKDVMSDTDSNNQLADIDITEFGKNGSKLFKEAPAWILEALETQRVAPNFHHYSLLASTYDSNCQIKSLFDVVAFAYDRNNVKFVSIMEGKRSVGVCSGVCSNVLNIVVLCIADIRF